MSPPHHTRELRLKDNTADGHLDWRSSHETSKKGTHDQAIRGREDAESAKAETSGVSPGSILVSREPQGERIHGA